MGFFNKGGLTSGSLQPLSFDRIKATLDSIGWNWGVDDDGDIGGGWEDGSYFFLIRGEQQEVLYVRGLWRGRLGASEFDRVLRACNDWNSSHFWPKVYAVLIDDDQLVRVASELVVDYEHGLSDAQLEQHLRCMVGTSEDFFAELAEKFPDAAAEYREPTSE